MTCQYYLEGLVLNCKLNKLIHCITQPEDCDLKYKEEKRKLIEERAERLRQIGGYYKK